MYAGQRPVGEKEPDVTTRRFGCENDTWWDLVMIYSNNLVFDWKEQEYYLNKCYGQEPGLFEEYPEEYGEFRRKFWDLVIGHSGLPDWRFELGNWGRENLYEKYPYNWFY